MTSETPGLKAGARAPEFSALDDTGARVSLTDFRGKWVVLYWYPKDDTPG
jgi:thioredoxin-dependent peroxiredoxin